MKLLPKQDNFCCLWGKQIHHKNKIFYNLSFISSFLRSKIKSFKYVHTFFAQEIQCNCKKLQWPFGCRCQSGDSGSKCHARSIRSRVTHWQTWQRGAQAKNTWHYFLDHLGLQSIFAVIVVTVTPQRSTWNANTINTFNKIKNTRSQLRYK